MKFTPSLAILGMLSFIKRSSIPFASAQTNEKISVGYNEAFDDSSYPISQTSCSDGSNGLAGKGYDSVGSIAIYPNVASVYTIAGWNSPNCGKCYQLDYNDHSLFVLAIDHAGSGAYLSKAALNSVTNGDAERLGRVDMEISAASEENCMRF